MLGRKKNKINKKNNNNNNNNNNTDCVLLSCTSFSILCEQKAVSIELNSLPESST
jgi:hypothetical protein